ncbi:MAG: PD-(D/E)XK nuclease family protein [Mucinivorans sp.]
MNTFIQDVAQSLLGKYGDNIAQLNIVFPSKRAERFFAIALHQLNYHGTRHCMTIDGLMQRFSGLKKADNLIVISKLHNIYSNYHPGETFDKFYSFGKLLLSDFDSIDKYMVDAAALYSIVSDTLDVENQFRDETHQKALEFWTNFQHSKAVLHKEQAFIQIWRSLYNIYTELGASLLADKVGYGGMIYRDAAQSIVGQDLSSQPRYVIIGLNALSKSECAVLEALQKSDKVDFIWDYSEQWLAEEGNETSWFLRSNIATFPTAEYFTKSTRVDPLSLNVVSTQSEVLQCKIAGKILSTTALRNNVPQLDERTAIVLTDENLLVPLLHSLPDCAAKINVSIGYPLSSTQAYVFLERLIALQNTVSAKGEFNHTIIKAILSHQFIDNQDLIERLDTSGQLYFAGQTFANEDSLVRSIFAPINRNYNALHAYLMATIDYLIDRAEKTQEVDRYALKIIRSKASALIDTIKNCKIDLSVNIYISLLVESVRGERLPYDGKSGEGVQIMGILETRALDFDNIILLSMNDDNFPDSKSQSSYIPQNLRVAYGLPSAREHSAIWSYYFYRLLERARKVTMLYCSASGDDSSGEPSRYILQLKYNSVYKLNENSIGLSVINDKKDDVITIKKDDAMIGNIARRALSPSAINRYINCPLAFYFNDIAGLREDVRSENEISNLDVGNTLHLAMQKLYQDIVGREHAQSMIQKITRDEIKSTVQQVIREVCGSKTEELAPNIAITEVAVIRMIENIVRYDGALEDKFRIEALEEKISCNIGGKIIQGTADRIDLLSNGLIRVVDYKSGGDLTSFYSVDEIINGEHKVHRSAIVQIMIYSLAAAKKYKSQVIPALYVARQMRIKSKVNPVVSLDDDLLCPIPQGVMAEFEDTLSRKLDQLTDVATNFEQSDNKPDSCQYCIYQQICRTIDC